MKIYYDGEFHLIKLDSYLILNQSLNKWEFVTVKKEYLII